MGDRYAGCVCDTNPETTEGPIRECPVHGDEAHRSPLMVVAAEVDYVKNHLLTYAPSASTRRHLASCLTTAIDALNEHHARAAPAGGEEEVEPLARRLSRLGSSGHIKVGANDLAVLGTLREAIEALRSIDDHEDQKRFRRIAGDLSDAERRINAHRCAVPADVESATAPADRDALEAAGRQLHVDDGNPPDTFDDLSDELRDDKIARAQRIVLAALRAGRVGDEDEPEIVTGTEAAELPSGTRLTPCDENGTPLIGATVRYVDRGVVQMPIFAEVDNRLLVHRASEPTPPLTPGATLTSPAHAQPVPAGSLVEADGGPVAMRRDAGEGWEFFGTGTRYSRLPREWFPATLLRVGWKTSSAPNRPVCDTCDDTGESWDYGPFGSAETVPCPDCVAPQPRQDGTP